MFVLHIALQGCLRGDGVVYGITADTGGHIRYLLDLVSASAQDRDLTRIVVATRLFAGHLGAAYAVPEERIADKVTLVRLGSASPAYCAKEAMHAEVSCFAENLIAWIAAQEQAPDLIHAHYADAGTVASLVEDRLGIPFVFTAHSLGRVKAAMLGEAAPRPDLARRIATEEAVLARAQLVIASSRDEAEVQYAGYAAYDPGRVRILPPGSDLGRFASARTSPRIDAAIDRFLDDPAKPALLALARPVARKNLAALVRAYGESPALQAIANLVIVAGTREDIDSLDGDMAATMRDLLVLIDRYDLYGRIAYPKTHLPDDVPAIYAYARARGGLFVNPALNEPFGLTLLEASAAGLPLVATDSGGPNDIVETCGNGLLVDPRSPGSIAAACLRILGDPALYARCVAGGARAAAAYDWDRHAARYHVLLRDLLAPQRATPPTRQLLVCDIDNTLIGCEAALDIFRRWRSRQAGLAFGVATGRSFHSAMAVLEQQASPRPQVMITSVGSEIYNLDDNGVTYTADAGWRRIIAAGWDRPAVHDALAGLDGLAPQGPLEQRALKLSYFGDAAAARRVRGRLDEAGLSARVIHSHGQYLDVLPAAASKGTAVDHVRALYDLPERAVFVAGDSGNDIEMLRARVQAIIVANYSDDLASNAALQHSYVARATHARGIIEGVSHFRRMPADVG
ncbi:HAD-IIB family hydrolase [Methylobacterium persicinum]|uniref:sucrose-phosphate synthase n=1 Tax=Methylobacterium persicinum TaxID=374426 RepID=A0ABU0HPF3_9HYPH|nr:HAD-IIB family hydrolase [Methylobacterium persicinum]MDQ0444165.1 sucrose-phosphate synthase [Methylobacterium persicinum]GJE36135.1 D-inositol-3-phosphate glycosyltransferase [Methylobacterium persicinum]